MANLGFEGIGELSVTMKVNAATVTAIGTNYDGAVGKTVALTGNDEVGYGAENAPLFGIIAKVEKSGLATITIKGFSENVAISATVAKKPAVGDCVAVDGAGGVVKYLAASTVAQGGIATSVDTTGNVATILLK